MYRLNIGTTKKYSTCKIIVQKYNYHKLQPSPGLPVCAGNSRGAGKERRCVYALHRNNLAAAL